jgi:TonB-dependent starch-binding outer membrane protein SusC
MRLGVLHGPTRIAAFALAVGGATMPSSLFAQGGATASGTVAGVVTDRLTRLPLQDARIAIPGTTLGALTNARGEYRIPNVPVGRVIVGVYRLGYAAVGDTVQMTAGQTVTADFRMNPSVTTLSDVVVTGTVGNQERRAQAATVSSLSAADIKKDAPISNVNELLQSRLPGVAVSAASGTAGTSRTIRIRGASSISLSNQPLVFIDGVRYADGNTDLGINGQRTDRLNDLNPDDIESVEVVKGPAAATLYGADASTGVIQIITKKGRTGANSFQQSIRTEYGSVSRNFTPPDNYGACTAALVAETSTNPLCKGQAPGTLVHDNPLLRTGAFRTGSDLTLGWTGRGGGQNYGYFLSGGTDRNIGVLPNNEFQRLAGRVNFNWIPNAKLTLESGASMIQSTSQLPDNDNNIYGFLGGALLGSPLTRRDDGVPSNNGWFGFNRSVDAISAIKNELVTRRSLLNVTGTYLPRTWFKNRVTVGADIVGDEATRYFPKNSGGNYAGLLNTGNNVQTRRNVQRYTVDYLADLTRTMGEAWQLNLSLGAQIIATRFDSISATGQGFTSNSSNVIGSASTSSAAGGRTDTRQVGYLGQLQAGYKDKLFVQAGARLDDFSAFGSATDPILLPKVGVSWVVSDYGFFQPLSGIVSSLRLRAAIGTTGRAPTAGASLQTLASAPSALVTGANTTVESGAVPLNPGNSDLKPEKGTEIEAGLDASFFNDRMNLEVTYFDKTSKNLLLQRPLPPSLGFRENPFVNIGEMYNRGFEVSIGGAPVRFSWFDWDSRLAFNTLDNKVVDLGGVAAFGTLTRVTQGFPLQSWVSRRIRNINDETGVVTVADTFEVVGNTLPTFEGSWSNTFTFFRNLRVTALVDTKQDFLLYNNSDFFRETQVVRSDNRLDPNKLSAHERLRRYGNPTAGQPAFLSENGTGATVDVVRDAYLQPGDFVRFRELGVNYNVPTKFLSRLRRVSSANVGVAFQNIGLWTDYEGFDPEVISNAGNQFERQDFFTLPNPRRALFRLNLTF